MKVHKSSLNFNPPLLSWRKTGSFVQRRLWFCWRYIFFDDQLHATAFQVYKKIKEFESRLTDTLGVCMTSASTRHRRQSNIDENQLHRLRPTAYSRNDSTRTSRHNPANNESASTAPLSKKTMFSSKIGFHEWPGIRSNCFVIMMSFGLGHRWHVNWSSSYFQTPIESCE